ncbi:MAG: glutamate 5-kinase [Clostridia bacterium]|nr:glutamate 5-kinase [Clostridia bacterium]
MENEKNKKQITAFRRIVVKIGSSSLTHDTGKLDLRRIEHLCRVLADLKNMGKEVILVSSGAVAAGVSKIGCARPRRTAEKQALASVGQIELMRLYGEFFSLYGQTVAQILLTKDVIDSPARREAAEATFEELLSMGIIPIINENDPISCYELEFGGNDRLSAYVGVVCHADLIVNLTDIDGYYDSDPRKNPFAKRIPYVESITDDMVTAAGGAGTERGTGGMQAKLLAAKIASESGIPMMIVSAADPEILYGVLDGSAEGTYFAASAPEI